MIFVLEKVHGSNEFDSDIDRNLQIFGRMAKFIFFFFRERRLQENYNFNNRTPAGISSKLLSRMIIAF